MLVLRVFSDSSLYPLGGSGPWDPSVSLWHHGQFRIRNDDGFGDPNHPLTRGRQLLSLPVQHPGHCNTNQVIRISRVSVPQRKTASESGCV